MSVEFLRNMWTEDWIAYLKVKKCLMDFTDDELNSLREFVKWLDNNNLLEFANKYNKQRTNYLTFLGFIGSLFQEYEPEMIFKITRRYGSLRKKEEAFFETAVRVRETIEKTS